jgi:NADP-dependent 3-hydroxy acid dehydrogenase YdfG
MIKDKVVIITGALSGIGEATARLLVRQGAKVVLGARRESRLKQIADEIGNDGGHAACAVLDVSSRPDNEAVGRFAEDRFGRVDVVFLNAGLMPTSPVSALKVDKWNEAVDININGVLNGVAAVMPSFIAQKSGQVIATSSVAGIKVYPGSAVYGGTKWFVRDFMEVLRMESAAERTNIRTATIYPAAISTELLGGITDPGAAEAMQKLYNQHASVRIASRVWFLSQSMPPRTRRSANSRSVRPAW